MRTPNYGTLGETLVALLLLVAPAACTVDQTGDNGSDGWGIGSGDVGVDTGEDGDDGADVDPPGDTRTTFRLVNDRDRAVWLAVPGPCGPEEPGWARLSRRDGGQFRMDERCDICNCSEVRRDGGCPVCGAPVCREQGEVERLPAGETVEWTWGGEYWTTREVDGQTCEERARPESDAPLSVEMCWRTGERKSSETCETLDFEYGDDRVTHRLESDPDPAPQPTTFELQNDSGSSVWINSIGLCSIDPTWVSVSDAEGGLALKSDCQTCLCSEVESGACSGGCAVRCAEPRAGELKAGETKRIEWDGVGYRTRQRQGASCHERTVPPVGRKMTATFCTVPGPTAFGNPDCQEIEFTYGEAETVRRRIASGGGGASETTFRLVNEGEEAIEVFEPDSCTGGEQDWVNLRDDSTPVDFSTDCTTCRCDQLESGSCAVCDRACVPRAKKLEPGASLERTWDGQGYRREQTDGMTCHEEWRASDGERLDARFCYKPVGTPAAEPTCETAGFRFAEDETVEHGADF